MAPPRKACIALSMATAMLAAGCASNKEQRVCPRVAVLSEAGSLTRFAAGDHHDILDIDFQAQIGDLPAQCAYPGEKGNRQVVVQLAPVFIIDRGSANSDGKASFTYFVSVVRTNEILSKQTFDLSLDFPTNRSRLAMQDGDPPITVTIPLPYRDAEYEYEVLVGFQLTPEELAYNQRWQNLGR